MFGKTFRARAALVAVLAATSLGAFAVSRPVTAATARRGSAAPSQVAPAAPGEAPVRHLAEAPPTTLDPTDGPAEPARPATAPLETAHRARPPARPAAIGSALTAARGAVRASAAIPSGWVVASHTIVSGGLNRAYLTVEPAALPASVPVVVLMHGHTMTPGGILTVTSLARQVGPAVLIVPAGWQRSWNAGGCCGAAYRRGLDDVGFVRSALDDVLVSTPAADPHRVYVAGFSNGGRMAYRLACDMPGVFAGLAAVEAVPVDSCPTLHPLEITIVAQQTDPLLTVDAAARAKYVDGHVEPTVAATVDRWRALDGCTTTPETSAEGEAVVHTWDCAAGTHLTYIRYPGGRHSWRPATATTPGATEFVLRMMGAAAGAA